MESFGSVSQVILWSLMSIQGWRCRNLTVLDDALEIGVRRITSRDPGSLQKVAESKSIKIVIKYITFLELTGSFCHWMYLCFVEEKGQRNMSG